MYRFLTLVLALASLVASQSTVTLLLPDFDQQSLLGSVIASDSSATTYSLACATLDSDDCGILPSFAYTQGPSTIAYSYTIDDTNNTEVINFGCVITSSTEGTCSATVLANVASMGSYTSITTTSVSGTDLGAQVVTLTNAGALASATLGTAAATTILSGTATSTTTGSLSSGNTTTSSQTTGSSASTTGSAGAASTKASTGGGPMITGAPWIGGAVAAFAYAAM